MKVSKMAAAVVTTILGGAMLAACGSSGGNGGGPGSTAALGSGCTPAAATSTAAPAAVDNHAGFTRGEAAQAQQDWTPQRMATAQPAPAATSVPSEFHACNQAATGAPGVVASGLPSGGGTAQPTGSAPPPSAVPTPYQNGDFRIEGKLFGLINATTEAECSATVIDSPNGNLVWTAAHCVHSGKGGSFFKEIVFVPDYNGNGKTLAQVAPLGVWSAKEVDTSNGWVQTGQETANPGSFVDYAVISFYPNDRGQELETLTGRGATPGFDLPASQVSSVTIAGYPAASPYNGNTMYDCISPVQQVADPNIQGTTGTNPMWSATCGMTAGASGGAWFGSVNGHEYLISNTSLGDASQGFLLGPYLAGPSGHNAQALYQEAVRTFEPGANPPASVGSSSGASAPPMGS